MPITKLLSGLPARTMDQAAFDVAMAQFMSDLPAWGEEVNTLAAVLNAISAGGAYAIPYTFDSTTADADPGAGKLRLSSTTQNAATVMRLDTTAGGQDYTSVLDTFDASTSTVKGSIRLIKFGDLTKWMTFDVTARAAMTGYRNLTVVCTGSSSASPFTNGDGVLLYFQRNGDKGDTPPASTTLHLRDEKLSGTTGGSSVAGAQVRTFNTTKRNTCGATVSGNQFTLQPGTYQIRASAPAFSVNVHQAYLYNVTDGAVALVGTQENANSSSPSSSRSRVEGEIVLAAAKTFELRHWTSTAFSGSGLGAGASAPGLTEVYSELMAEKNA